MALEPLKSSLAGEGVVVKSALLTGADVDTDIAVSGWSWVKNPQVIMAVHLEGTATYAAPADVQSEIVAGTTDDDIQLTTTDTTGDHVLLVWAQRA